MGCNTHLAVLQVLDVVATPKSSCAASSSEFSMSMLSLRVGVDDATVEREALQPVALYEQPIH